MSYTGEASGWGSPAKEHTQLPLSGFDRMTDSIPSETSVFPVRNLPAASCNSSTVNVRKSLQTRKWVAHNLVYSLRRWCFIVLTNPLREAHPYGFVSGRHFLNFYPKRRRSNTESTLNLKLRTISLNAISYLLELCNVF